ncbi:MAG: hypothetical protein Q9211_002133 [Gyalolechia sp. 1 TL-2023]
MNDLFTPALTRFASRPGNHHVKAILSSPRYSAYRDNIYRPVSGAKFTGYWILRNSFTDPKSPSTSDITILYLHGGGYITSQPGHYLLFLLRLAECILNQDLSVSIFALDYSLAPENTFPAQLAEAEAAYKYVINEQEVASEKIILAGDSAGGHLALSLLVHLHKPHPSIPCIDAQFSKPGLLLLLSPLLSLHHEPPSFVRNASVDTLTARFLRRTASLFLTGRAKAIKIDEEPERNSPYIEFLTPEPRIDWQTVLPPRVWVSAGGDEIFLDHITQWVKTVQEIVGGDCVTLEVGLGKEHVWQWMETLIDEGLKKSFLNGKLGDERIFEATSAIGKAVLDRMRGQQGVT